MSPDFLGYVDRFGQFQSLIHYFDLLRELMHRKDKEI